MVGHGLDRRVAISAHVEVATQVHVANFPEQAGLDDLLLRVDEVGRAFSLGADLDDAFMLAGGIEHRLAFTHVAADRFLTINIRSRLNRGDAMQRMPMVRTADQHDVEVFLFEHRPKIGVSAWRLLRFLPLAGDLHGLGLPWTMSSASAPSAGSAAKAVDAEAAWRN